MDFNINKSESLGYARPYRYDKRSRSTTKNDKSPRINGKLALRENSYDVTFRQVYGTSCMYGIGSRDTPYWVPGHLPVYSVDSQLESLISTCQKQATEKAYAKVANVQMSLAETIAERAKTISVVVAYAKQVKAIWDYCHGKKPLPKSLIKDIKGTFKSKKNLNKTAAEKWLEFSFMWAPLLEDIKTLIKGIKPIQGIYVKGYSTVSDSKLRVTDIFSSVSLNGQYNSNFSERRVKCTVKLFVTIDDPLVALQSEMGFLTPVSAWNIIPFSFVVDWFFKVGAFIERICTPGKTITGGSTTTLVNDKVTDYGLKYGRYGTRSDNTIVWYTNAGSGITVATQKYYRTLGVPSPFFITTCFNQLSWWNLTATWALLSAIFTKKD